MYTFPLQEKKYSKPNTVWAVLRRGTVANKETALFYSIKSKCKNLVQTGRIIM